MIYVPLQDEMKEDVVALQQQKDIFKSQAENIQHLSEKIDKLINNSEVVLKTEKLSFSVELDQNNRIKSFSSDLGKCAAQTSICVQTSKQRENEVQLCCNLGEQQAPFWKAGLEETYDPSTLFEIISISFDSKEELDYQRTNEQWQYQSEENGEWKEITTPGSNGYRSEGNSAIIELEKIPESDLGRTVDFQYNCFMENPQGGSFLLQIYVSVSLADKTMDALNG